MTTVNQKTNRVTIELSAAEICQIDSLVKKGLYKSREDFIRQAVTRTAEDDAQAQEWGGAPVYLSLRMH